VTGFDWSPDGRSIAFGHQRDPLINSGRTGDISIIDVASKQVRPLVTTPGGDFFGVWSPDSRWIMYSSAGGDTVSNFYTNTQLFRISRDGGQATRIAADIDENVGGLTWTRTGTLYGVAWQGAGSRRLVAIDPMSGRSRILPGGPDIIFGADFAADGRTVALSGATPTTLAEIYRASIDGSSLVRSTAVTAMTGQMRDWQVGTSEIVKWKSRDSATIEGVLHKPVGFDPRRKYPLFVVIHGGPTGIDTPTPWTGYVYPVMQWLAKGALVLRPNYRGSAGYGAKFRALNVRNLGVGDAWDVLSGVDHLVAQGIVDTTRMGAMGWSQGGYISAFLTTTTGRFKAISVGAGISNWMTYYVNTDIHPFTRQYLKATPWDDPEIYAKTSPMTYIKQAKTPTLIQHGEFDRRVPIANAYELFQGLQDRGVPVRLVVYKGFGHGIDKPKEQLAAYWHNWQWFGKYVWGEEVRVAGEVR
jgi:dipeptidyl aminopeptidase/acylaminoacyl peptidase